MTDLINLVILQPLGPQLLVWGHGHSHRIVDQSHPSTSQGSQSPLEGERNLSQITVTYPPLSQSVSSQATIPCLHDAAAARNFCPPPSSTSTHLFSVFSLLGRIGRRSQRVCHGVWARRWQIPASRCCSKYQERRDERASPRDPASSFV